MDAIAEPVIPPPPRLRGRRARRVAIGLAAVVALYALAVGVAGPPLARHFAAKQLAEKLGRSVSIDDVSINPFTLAATVKGFRVHEPDGKADFVAFDALDVDASASSLYRLAPVVDALTVTGLRVNVVRDAGTHFNFSDILARLARDAEAASRARGGAPEEEARFSIANVRLVGASIDVDDRPKGRKHRVADMAIAIPFISSLPTHRKEYVQPAFSANVNGAAVKLTGETLPFENSLRTHFNVHLDGMDVRRYLAYLPAALPVSVDSGVVDARIAIRFTQASAKDPSIDIAGTVALRDFAASTADGRFASIGRIDADLASFDPIRGKLALKSVKVSDARGLGGAAAIEGLEAGGIEADLRKREVRVATLASRGGVIAVKRAADGALVLPRFPTAVAPAGAPAAPVALPPWQVDVARATVAGFEFTLADAAVRPTASHRVAIESLEAQGLTSRDGGKGKLAGKLTFGKAGKLDLDSDFTLEPLRVGATLDARNLDLVPLRAYVAEFPTVGLKSGAVSARGKLTLGGRPEALRISWRGTGEVAQLATVDTAKREDLLNWKSVRASAIELDIAPGSPVALGVGEIVVDRIYSRLVVNPDGTLNVQALRTGAPPAKGPVAPPPPPRNVRIDRVTFVDGRLDITDNFIRPNYSADVGELQGSVTNLSSQPESRATVDLKGRYDRASPVVIAGTVNPLRGDLFLDLAAKGADIELPRLTAYSQRYAGYGITGGKLTLDVKYHIDGGKLEGRNKVLIDQLTFGDKVESPEATKLPVLFAVNLLKDSKGQINLELPVSGSLDDPQFDVAALAMQVFGNLLKKAVTAPFSLLAAAVGGGGGKGSGGDGGEMAFVEYAPGGAEIEERSRAKLESLVKALRERPGLKLELAAQTDAKRDGEALRRAELQRRLEAMRAADKAAGDDARYLKALLARERIEPPAAAQAVARAEVTKGEAPKAPPPELTAAEMEALLLARIEVGEAELGELARRRGDGARAWLVAEGRLPADRVVMAQPGGESAQGARVAFSLR